MMKRLCGWTALVVCSVFASACTMRVDDSRVFRPPSHPAPAETVAELQRWPIDDLRAHFPEAEAEQGFIGAGDNRIAYTLASLPNDSEEPRPFIVYCGGNASDRMRSGVDLLRKSLPYGDVMLFDYPGYGDSPGTPSADALEAMAPRVIDFVETQSEGRKLVYWGHSLGGFVCSRLASETAPADGLVLEATARNALEVAEAWRPWYIAAWTNVEVNEDLARFDVAEALREFQKPILVLGAERDRTLPIELSRSLVAALQAENADVEFVEFPKAGHVSIAWQPEFRPLADSYFASIAGAP